MRNRIHPFVKYRGQQPRMSNAELAAAIDEAQSRLNCTGHASPAYPLRFEHLEYLLEVQRKRAAR